MPKRPAPPGGYRGSSCCAAKLADGTPCKAAPRPGKQYCTFHDPELADARAEGRKRGGVVRNTPAAVLPTETPDAVLRSYDDVAAFLAVTINQLRTGRLAVGVGNAVGQLSAVLLRALEGGELERRIAALEAARPTLPPPTRPRIVR